MIPRDKIGPEVVKEYNNSDGVKAFLVIDNTKFGPGKGGLRLAKGIAVEEIFRLARAMTYKNTMAGLPFGGAKSGIVIPDGVEKSNAIKWFAEQIKEFVPEKYVAGPDMSTGEDEMKIIAETIGTKRAATGKPVDMGGLPHELGSTGFGVAKSVLTAVERMGLNIKDVTIAIEGFGNVGTFTAKYLSEKGAKITAVSDSKGTAYLKEGFDVEKLIRIKKETRAVKNYPGCEVYPTEKLFSLNTNVLIPGTRPDVINQNNYDKIKAKLIVEAANIPITESVEEKLHNMGVLIVPDFVANAGGVISSWVEYENSNKTGKTQQEVIESMFKVIEEKIVKNTKLVLDRAEKEKMSPRKAAKKIVEEKLLG